MKKANSSKTDSLLDTLSHALRPLPFWIGYKRERYGRHPLPELAIGAELRELLQASAPRPWQVECEVDYRKLAGTGSSQSKNDGRPAQADVAIRDSDEGHYLAAIEVKRWCGGHAKVRDQVRDQVRAQVGAQVWRALDPSLCSWAAWADAHESIGVTGLAASKGLRTVAAQSPWWWPMRDIAILTDRPTVMARDNQGRLHNPTGPAIEYADGFGVHAWHGTRVPADLITPGWDLPTALRHDNAEVRRCAIERIAGQDGWAKIITAAGWEQVGDAHPDPGNPGQTLALYHVPAARDGGLYPEPVRLLHCVNATVERDGTRHEFGLTVPAGIGDPVEAAAWTFGLTQNEYARVQRAC